jgi:hypothetical protein
MAASPVITCPECEKKFRAKADVRGKKIKCPFCAESFVVPIGDEEARSAIQEKQGSPGDAGTIPLAGEGGEPVENDNPYGITELDLSPRCPNCANEMTSADAVVCLICGYNTLTREWGKVEKTIGVTYGRQFTYLLPAIFSLSCLVIWLLAQLIYSVYWPYWVAGVGWIDWTDHESLRMWSTMVGLAIFFVLGRYTYRRFIVKPLPDELKVD